MGPIGVPELSIILVIIVIIFGVGKLPEIGGALGKGIKEFKTESSADNDSIDAGDSEKASSITANTSATKSEEVGARTERREVRADEI